MSDVQAPSAQPYLENDIYDVVSDLYDKSLNVIRNIQNEGFKPEGQKTLERRFSLVEVSELVGRSVSAIRDAEANGRLPEPEKGENNRRMGFTLADVNLARDVFGTRPWRAETDDPLILSIGSFKGGVGKTTTSVYLSQYLALQGYRVLLIDTDPQGSATALFGYVPEYDIKGDTETLYGVLGNTQQHIAEVIRSTYWDGLDLIPANLHLFQAEYEMMMLSGDNSFMQLRENIDMIKHNYDVIVIDSPPSLGTLSLNVMYAADALLLPIPAQFPDMSSGNIYLRMLNEAIERMRANKSISRGDYKFAKVLITKFVEGPRMNDVSTSTQAVFSRIYERVFSDNILKSKFKQATPIENAFSMQKTLFELDKADTVGASNKRAFNIINSVCSEVEDIIRSTWPSHVREMQEKGLK